MTLLPYFTNISEELRRKSEQLRQDFASHRPSAGENREALVADLLRQYLPRTFGVDTGLVLSTSGQFSHQADLLVVDQITNAPLYPTSPNRIWLAEAVYALIEVKTNLTPTELADGVAKSRRFKQLPRRYADLPALPRIPDVLTVIWGFEGPAPETIRDNVAAAIDGVPAEEQPDFVIVPGKFLAKCGAFHEMSEIGGAGSATRRQLERENGGPVTLSCAYRALASEHALLMWLIWFSSWLGGAGTRTAPLISYLPTDLPLGSWL